MGIHMRGWKASNFLETLCKEERINFRNKTNGWCLLLNYILCEYIRTHNCSILEAPDFCFRDGTTSKDTVRYVRRSPKIYRREGENLILYI